MDENLTMSSRGLREAFSVKRAIFVGVRPGLLERCKARIEPARLITIAIPSTTLAVSEVLVKSRCNSYLLRLI